ncbi:mycofactocin biosynthesis glycosyltransferase MftF [Pseudonocardia endophytica]|uniref:mycofactocin biosynthesis glycosyltransferase MftF n=1 Tax=Pseudonocardia endophytica TaxID=401976 RepID=UPI001051494E|nr:mycofactocin biosynthesis glycosyltransferase MftF [Pseudonocardia endophytica]
MHATDGPSDLRLPDGFTVALDRRVRRIDGGAALLGGAPPRLVHLGTAAVRLLDGTDRITVADATTRALSRRLLDTGMAHPVVPRADRSAQNADDGRPGPPVHAVPGPEQVTVVVPVKDRPLDRLLAALPPGLGGLVVVDDGSDDPDLVARGVVEAGGTVLRHRSPRGPAAARNAGLAAAGTAFVVFLDSDVVPRDGWLEPLLAHTADPAVGLVAPRIVALDAGPGGVGPSAVVARYEAVRSSLDLGPDPALIVPRSRVAYVPSAAMLVRVAAVGGTAFDEDMHVAEDVDLVLRLHARGWRMRFEPSARVAHDHRTRPSEWLRRKAFYGTGAAPLALRHPGAVPPVVLSPWSAAVCGLLLAQRRPAVLAAGVVTAVATERLSRKLTRLRRPRTSAARLTGLGLAGAVWQTGSALTRHFWPVAAPAMLISTRARRAVLVAALAEGIVDWWTHRNHDPSVRPGPVGHLLAHRLDDLAYGTGLWWGAVRHGTIAPLRPEGPAVRRP